MSPVGRRSSLPPPGPSPPGPLSLPHPPSLTGRGGEGNGRVGAELGRSACGVRDASKGREPAPFPPFLLPPLPVREGGWGRERRAGVVRVGREGGFPASAPSVGHERGLGDD